ncbi:MAG: glycosyltransferase family 2 protein [Candidatus Odinarchaeota archaeon]
MQNLLSIVIIGKNEAKTLPRVFQSVLKASEVFSKYYNEYPDVIYVDSDSEDYSIKIAKKFSIKYKIIYGKSNAARGRIEGVKEVNSKYIFFLDGDTEVTEGWLLESVKIMEDNDKIAGLGGILKFNYYNKDKLVKRIDNYRGTNRNFQNIYDGVGGTFLYRLDVYNKAGGFNSKYKVGEEFDLMLRVLSLGYQVVRLKIKMAIHHDYKSLEESFIKRYLFTHNILITGNIIRNLALNKITFRYLLRRFWIYFLHIILIFLILFFLPFKKYILSMILIIILFISHLVYKKFNVMRTIISLFTMNFYSIGLILGILKIRSNN